jgi:hypothetical protein
LAIWAAGTLSAWLVACNSSSDDPTHTTAHAARPAPARMRGGQITTATMA